jgi:circadian clock protein KaiC
MNRAGKVVIEKFATGVPGLDDVLGGGLPLYSFNLIAGEPGAGKTTLAQQIVFDNARPESPALYFTVLGEPPIKMLRYQQQFSFFDPAKLGESVRFLSLTDEVLERGLEGVMARIVREVEESNPSFVVVDSFRTLVSTLGAAPPSESELQGFTQRLALHLTAWQTTSFLVGEYRESDKQSNPVFTIADGIFWMTQATDRNSVVRKIQVVKIRGQEQMPGLHTFRITDDGLRVFPRISLTRREGPRRDPKNRVSTGVAGLDEMMGGGIPAGDSILLAGPTGTGKSMLATQFIAAGAAQGEAGVLTVFEEHANEYLARAEALGFGLDAMIREGTLEVIYLRPLDLSPDETLHEILEAVERVGATRVVIDSLSGFELALAPTFRVDFRESLYRLISALTGRGITVLTTMELGQHDTELRFTPNVISFLADDLLMLRYVEVDQALRKVIGVAKMRGSQHSKDFREYEITDSGVRLLGSLDGFEGRISGASFLTREG